MISPQSAASATRRRGYIHFVWSGFVARSRRTFILAVEDGIGVSVGLSAGDIEMRGHVGAGGRGVSDGEVQTGRCFNGAEFVRWEGVMWHFLEKVSLVP
jgi:hypothetical protein